MSSLESAIAVAGEAPLLSSLDFSLPPASTSCTDRRQHVRAYPTSASTLSPTGTKTCRIRLGGDDFVSAESCRLQFTINNGDAANPLTPVAGPWGVWSQCYLRSNGVEISNIPQLGRFMQQYSWNQLTMQEQFAEAGICGLYGSWNAADNPLNTPSLGTIAAGASYTVLHKLPISLFESGKLLPTRYAPLELEISCANAADWLNVAAGHSQTYTISNVQILYDAYVLDEAVQESFYKSLLASRTLSIPFMYAAQFTQAIPQGSTSYSFTAVRAFSRLSHIWLTFRGTGPKASEFLCPTTGNATGASPALSDISPSARLSIGPHYWPDAQPCATIPEFYYMFQKACGGMPNITRDTYLNGAFTMVFDVRKVPYDPTSSISTRSGDLLRIDLQNLTANAATEVTMTLFSFAVCCVRESGVTVLT